MQIGEIKIDECSSKLYYKKWSNLLDSSMATGME